MVDEPEYGDGPDPEDDDDQRDLTDLIDELLADNRPERYDDGEREWQDPVIDKVADIVAQKPQENLADYARRRVRAREGQAVTKLKNILREIFDNGRLPLGWGEGEWKQLYQDVLHLPLKIGKSRVQFGAATTADWEQWIGEHQEEADQRAAADQRTGNGGRMILDWMLDQRVNRTDDLRPIESE